MRRRQILASQAPVPDELIPTCALVQKSPDPHECPKCGRIVKQGKVMHQRHCKGK